MSLETAEEWSAAPAVARSLEVRALDLGDCLQRGAIRLGAAGLALLAPRFHLHRRLAQTEAGTALLDSVWRHSAATLLERTRDTTNPIGSNRLRLEAGGEVLGRMMAIGLHDGNAANIGILLVVRTTEQAKFTARDAVALRQCAAQASAIVVSDHDPETGLLSRSSFERKVRALAREIATEAGCVLYGDIDELHVLNKVSGFLEGDRAIAAIGKALREAQLPPGTLVCHLSGDRFTLYTPRTTLAQGRQVATQLCERIARLGTAEPGGPRAYISISFGIAELSAAAPELGHALAAAETACKTAKERGRGRVEVYQDADRSIVRRHEDVMLAGRLREALDAGKIDVLAQPIVWLREARPVTHFELLARIVGEAGVRMSPELFLSAAMRYHLLPELDRLVLTRVFEQLQRERETLSKRPLRFSLNLSGPTLGDPEFLEWLTGQIGERGLPGEWLQFEFTESAAVANVSRTQTMMRRLASRGVHFALDDFGTGVSSLAYLKSFHVQMLKLDGSFVRDLGANPRGESLVMGIAWLARSMGIETVAECVETTQVRDRLVELGIDRGQGFLFGRPEPLSELLDRLAGRTAAPVSGPEAAQSAA